jgi:hypothetical protein
MAKQSPIQRTQFIMMFFAFAFGMALSSLLTHYGQQKAVAEEPEEILFIYRGIEKYQADVIEEDRKKLHAVAREKYQIVENASLRQYFLDEAHKNQVPVAELIKRSMPWEAVSDEDVTAFYEKNKQTLNKPLTELDQQIRKHLEQQRIKAARRHLLDDLMRRGDLVLLPPK